MKQKGFTLIELLGVIIILGLILLISAPSILESLRVNKKNEYNNFVGQIYIAAEVYVVENPNEFDWTEDNQISLRNLISNDYINGNMINPETEKKILEENSIIEVSKNSDNLLVFNYVYIE